VAAGPCSNIQRVAQKREVPSSRGSWERFEAEARIRQEAIDRAQTRLEALTERFLSDLSRLRGDMRELVGELSAGLRAEQARLILQLRERIRGIASGALDDSIDRAEDRLRAVSAEAERDARARIAEVAKTARFRLEMVERAQERERRIREATERVEREMAERVREAELRLLDALQRAAAG
jgi:hypothetical protein